MWQKSYLLKGKKNSDCYSQWQLTDTWLKNMDTVFKTVKIFRSLKCSCIPIWVLLCKTWTCIPHLKRPQKHRPEKRSTASRLSLVKLYLICCCQSLLQHLPLLLWWPEFHGWSWQCECWCRSGCWRKRARSWCWLQLHFACCLLGYPGTSEAGNAVQEKQDHHSQNIYEVSHI